MSKKRQRKRYINPVTMEHGKQIDFLVLLGEINNIIDSAEWNTSMAISKSSLQKICEDMDQQFADLVFAYNFQKFPVLHPAEFNRHRKDELIIGFKKTTFDTHTNGIMMDFIYR